MATSASRPLCLLDDLHEHLLLDRVAPLFAVFLSQCQFGKEPKTADDVEERRQEEERDALEEGIGLKT